jgi:hypothetical protein
MLLLLVSLLVICQQPGGFRLGCEAQRLLDSVCQSSDATAACLCCFRLLQDKQRRARRSSTCANQQHIALPCQCELRTCVHNDGGPSWFWRQAG